MVNQNLRQRSEQLTLSEPTFICSPRHRSQSVMHDGWMGGDKKESHQACHFAVTKLWRKLLDEGRGGPYCGNPEVEYSGHDIFCVSFQHFKRANKAHYTSRFVIL